MPVGYITTDTAATSNTLTCYADDDWINPKDPNYSGSINDPNVYYNGQLSDIDIGSANDGDDDDSHTITIAQVDSLTWETYSDNTAIDTCPRNGGKRIYPGYKDPSDSSSDRVKVTIKATLNCSPASEDGIYVYFSAWDVDDPSADETNGDLDPDDDHADPNYHSIDNRGGFGFPTSDSISVLANGSSIVEATFTVSKQPGDNYRITATTCSSHNSELNNYKVENNNLPATVKRSEMLTTWRKLWVERDSMDSVPSSGSEMNRVTGTADSYTYNSSTNQTTIDLGQNLPNPFDDTNQFEGGRYVAGGNTYTVVSSSARPIVDDEVVVSGDCSSEPMTYILFDDDDQTLLDTAYYCSFSSHLDSFREAYIEPDYLSSSYSDIVDFNLNLLDTELVTGVDYDNEQDVWSEANFWACLVVSCYQPTYNSDIDPDDAVYMDPYITWGVTVEDSDNACCIFLETIRDVCIYSESKIVAHEVGHSGGGDHGDGGLMTEGCAGGDTFSDSTKETFRSHSTWLSTN